MFGRSLRIETALCVALLALGALPAAAEGSRLPRKPAEKATAEEAARKLRTMYFAQDFEGGRTEEKRLAARFPGSTEVLAWSLMHQSRLWLGGDAVPRAEKLITEHPGDPWGWFALTGALQRNADRSREALRTSQKALSLAKTHPDFLWLRASVLASEGPLSTALAFLDSVQSKVPNPAELLVVRAVAYRRAASQGEKTDPILERQALEAFSEARRIDPTNVNAHARAGESLLFANRAEEAYPLLRKAVRLSPLSAPLYALKWRAIRGRSDRKPEQKRAEIESDIRFLLKERGDNPEVVQGIANEYGELGLKEQQRKMEDRVLRLEPDGLQAEWVLVNRWRRQEERTEAGGKKNPKEVAVYRRMLRDFIRRPSHRADALLGEAYGNLFLSLSDDATASADEILALMNGMVKHEKTNQQIFRVRGPVVLADRKAHLNEAERIVLDGIQENRREARNREHTWHYDSRKSQKQWAKMMEGQLLDALGWVRFNQGRREEAEQDLQRSLKLSPGRMETLFHLGRLFESAGDLPKAEGFYVRGMAVQTPGPNPSEKAIKDLYVRRYGSAEGFESYLEKFRIEDRAKRKERILADRVAKPEIIPPFSLRALAGTKVGSMDLRGKIAVINFWGLWCGWCLGEMPEIQLLHEKYRNDPGVAVLTLDNDPNPDLVREWMKKNKFDFKVLLDDGYVRRVGVRGFPTTWFVDQSGRLVFEHTGWSQKLVEEFGWRIEALRSPESPPHGKPSG
ncbi:MAG TPA: redoxin domain-containing protein [Candidatus Polarisedimenticolia bacterium]|jgi:tetratricopeptide (TPR) repeat protein|nr:redoxin domain-containing protein [Candidatus Polarisedimenticolia bacterium]